MKYMKIHAKLTDFIVDPCVIRITHKDVGFSSLDLAEFRKLQKWARSLINGTYGYSHPVPEHLSVSSNTPFTTRYGQLTLPLSREEVRSYWGFEDEIDAMQFKLAAGEPSARVKIWPSSTRFTIVSEADIGNHPLTYSKHINKFI